MCIHSQSLLDPSKSSHGSVNHDYEASLLVPGQLEKPPLICGRGNTCLPVPAPNENTSASISTAVLRP